jgi:hypothetical protein
VRKLLEFKFNRSKSIHEEAERLLKRVRPVAGRDPFFALSSCKGCMGGRGPISTTCQPMPQAQVCLEQSPHTNALQRMR